MCLSVCEEERERGDVGGDMKSDTINARKIEAIQFAKKQRI